MHRCNFVKITPTCKTELARKYLMFQNRDFLPASTSVRNEKEKEFLAALNDFGNSLCNRKYAQHSANICVKNECIQIK